MKLKLKTIVDKQTVLEWFIQEFEKEPTKANLDRLNEQAKEMEKQQQCYSEEEVITFGEFIFKHTLLAHSKGVKNLFEQFKKK
jgi:hypothetical protein